MAGIPQRSLDGECGPDFTHLHVYTLSTYSAAGTAGPAVGDIVIPLVTGNWYVCLAANDTTKHLGEVVKIEQAHVSTGPGYIVVRWLDAIRVVACTTDDASTVTLLDSLIKDGDTTVLDNFDAGATTGPIVAVSKPASGAGEVYGLVFGS